MIISAGLRLLLVVFELQLLIIPTNANSPPINAKIQSNWPNPHITTLYLETLAQESPSSLVPFLQYLTLNPSPPTRFPLLTPEEQFQQNNPVLTPLLQSNESFSLLESQLSKSLLVRRKGDRESLALALAARECSVVLEAMRIVAKQRERELGNGSTGECENWIEVAGRKACGIQQFWEIVGVEQSESIEVITLHQDVPTPTLYPFDHLYPSNSPDLPLVIFYATPTSFTFTPSFHFLHTLASPSSEDEPHQRGPRLRFAIRWNGPGDEQQLGDRMIMSGFGASLDIKKSDYLAIDDRGLGKEEKKQEDAEEKKQLKMEPVKKADISELGLRATEYILSSEDPLSTFTSFTGDFPLLASRLSTLVPVPSTNLTSEILSNQMSSPATSSNSFSINGLPLLPATSVDAFSLLRTMRRERKYITDLQRMSLSRLSLSQCRDIISSPELNVEGNKVGVGKDGRLKAEGLGELFDASDRKEKGGLVVWWNDLEKDKRYREWPKKLKDLLRPVYPGQMNLLARNLHNLVLILDFSRPDHLRLITESVKTYVSRGIPVRFGVVPLLAPRGGAEVDDLSEKMGAVTWYLVDTVGRGGTMGFLSKLAALGDSMSLSTLTSAYTNLASQSTHPEGGPLAKFEEIFELESTKERLEKAREYGTRLGVTGGQGKEGAFFLNGAYFVIDDDFTQNLQRSLGLHTQFLQQEVYLGNLEDSMDVNYYFYTLPTTYGRRNPYIFPVQETNPLRIVNLVDATGQGEMAVFHQFHTSYIEAADAPDQERTEEEPVIVTTIHIIVDLESSYGRTLARHALRVLRKSRTTRINLVHNPLVVQAHPYSFSTLISRLIASDVLIDVLPSEWIKWIDESIDPLTGPGKVLNWPKDNPMLPFAKSAASEKELQEAREHWEKVGIFVENVGFKKGETGLVVNGRVIGPLADGAFNLEDLEALVDYEVQKRIHPTVKAIKNAGLDESKLSGSELSRLYMLATSIVSEAYLPDPAAGMFTAATVERSLEYRQLYSEHTSYFGPNFEKAVYEVAVVIDPLTELAQKWAPLIETLAKMPTVFLRLHLNPQRHLTDLPLKRFYRYSFPSGLTFDEHTGKEVEPGVSFQGIPDDTLLTFGMDVQRSWIAFPKSSVHDLDNIRLADLPASSRVEGVQAVFELESIIVEGHARDMPIGQPPRGLQLELSSTSEGKNVTVDTICMSNLGYFQLKANPGPWTLSIRSGKSSEVFALESVGADGWKSGDVSETGSALVVSTLEGLTLYPRFRRRPGHERTELLEDDAPAKKAGGAQDTFVGRVQNMMPFLSPFLGGKSTGSALTTTGSGKAEINIFTVASGLLYERMAFLMMVSVMRHTKSTVKFWFIQNFLSPSFKAFIPHIAKEYGFDYELVTYKWPHWLRAQTEKQRTIWGYKILFLDVLFPLELDRVIFVDSDQIVRADLKELVDLDLKGAPYGYAPMGSDREETAGFRFWDSGYWKEHLKGLPYHISALYVVDLDRFRQIAAGDRLRQQYQALSADPNSLANLDQDLPNNMQTSLPIFTLDQSWLWCETWCSDESLSKAKTIDLCNNPLTHEPKLARAKRLIPEWTVYDNEVAALAARVAEEASSNSSDDFSSQSKGGINAFSKKADELVQAVEQSAERDEFVESHAPHTAGESAEEGRVKDEL
ncbi:hypothetical protein T439DRAFT_327029 [Meredithblackwellia eburnea MCA 4105]